MSIQNLLSIRRLSVAFIWPTLSRVTRGTNNIKRHILTMFVAALLAGLGPVSTLMAQTRRNVGNVTEEPAAHHSWVRHLNDNVIISAAQYAKDIQNNRGKVGSVDIVMEQCFGGGFLREIQKLMVNQTFASATAWNECSLTLALPQPPAGQPRNADLTLIENFTRSWRKSADLFPQLGMLNHFRIAAGDGIVTVPANADPKARYAPPGQTIGGNTYVEHPQYESPDVPILNNDGSIGGPNNTRTLTPPPNGGNEYAILVQWGKLDSDVATRNDAAVDIARMNKTLRKVIGAPVPLRNIVVLYGNTARGTNLGPFKLIRGDGDANGEDLPTFFVDGPNSRQNWLDALAGKLFVNSNDTLGITYGPDDRLFIYNTGHGGNENQAAPPVALQNGVRYNVALADGFDAREVDPELASNVTDFDGTDLLQVSTRLMITDPAVQLTVNGTLIGPLANLLITDPNQIVDVTPFVTGSTVTYQVRIPHSLLAQDPASATIDLTGVSSAAATGDLVAAFTFEGGDQSYIAVIPRLVLDLNPVPPAIACASGPLGGIDVGWAFTPTSTITIDSVQTRFSSVTPAVCNGGGCTGWVQQGPTPNFVTLEIYQGIPANGGALLRSANFTPAAGSYSGPAGSDDLVLQAGTQYFIGFFNVQGLGNNGACPGTTSLPGYFQGAPDAGHKYYQSFGSSDPTLRFLGPQ